MFGLYRDNGKEKGNYYSIIGSILGVYGDNRPTPYHGLTSLGEVMSTAVTHCHMNGWLLLTTQCTLKSEDVNMVMALSIKEGTSPSARPNDHYELSYRDLQTGPLIFRKPPYVSKATMRCSGGTERSIAHARYCQCQH